MADAPISVVIVDDSPSVRAVLRRFLSKTPTLRIVGEAEDGLAAVETVRRLAPDVLLLDLVLPKLDGFGVLERLATSGAVPTVLLTSRADRSEVRSAFEALGAGAFDLLPKPDDPASWHLLAETLPGVLAAAATGGRRVAALPARSGGAGAIEAIAAPSSGAPATAPRPPESPAPALQWLAIGASTGGPGALRDLLSALPAPLSVRVLVVQHIARGFEPGLADWLAGSLALDVRVAVAGELVPEGGVRIAPGGSHLNLGGDRRLVLDATAPPRRGHRPAVDELFLSLVAHEARAIAAVVLSGMGTDGAQGLLALRRGGALCLAQDEASSAVFGMPRAALELGAAEAALAPRALGARIARRILERR